MNTDNSGLVKFIKGFGYAFQGLWYAVKYERNMRFHIGAGAFVLYIMRFFQLSGAECAAVYICIGLVIALELVNTAIESVVDMVCKGDHPLAKVAKDCGAGAVLTAAIASVGVAVKLFWQPAVWKSIIAFHLQRPVFCGAIVVLAIVWIALVLTTPKKPDDK